MAPVTDIVDLGQLGLKPGGGIRFETLVPVGEFVFGAQRYVLEDDPVPVTLDISRTSSGNHIRVRTNDTLKGPCMRCYYADFKLPLQIDHSEVHEPHLDEELASDYVNGQELDLAALVRDAVGLALPTSISSPTDENGVCTECESSAEQLAKLRDSGPEPAEPLPDPRWAKLRELEL
ncbi:MAG: YceD family protein [Solirubrobacterales bacterium]